MDDKRSVRAGGEVSGRTVLRVLSIVGIGLFAFCLGLAIHLSDWRYAAFGALGLLPPVNQIVAYYKSQKF